MVQVFTEGFNGLPGVTRFYSGYKRLQKVTGVIEGCKGL